MTTTHVPTKDPISIILRSADDNDDAAIQAIYAHHVVHGLASFEEEPPDVTQIRRRRCDILQQDLPYLVAQRGDEVAAFAYAGRYRPRAAYRYTIEDAVYVAPVFRRQGIGFRLLCTLVERSSALGYRQMIAVIGDSGNAASIGLHTAAGFAHVGILRAVGFKHGRWVDSVLMQRGLGQGDGEPPGAGPIVASR